MLTKKEKEFLAFHARTHKNSYGLDCAMKLLRNELEHNKKTREYNGTE